MNGVADAVTSRAAPAHGDAPSYGARSSHRPTLRYGEEPSLPFEPAPVRRRTVPYGGSEPTADVEGALPHPPDPAWADDMLERPSGIRLRCAPLVQEWYDLAGAGRK
jgi:hypothetical protein